MSNQVQPTNFSQDQVALIKKMVAPDATDDELAMFLHACRRYNLDPLQRQIFCIHRNESRNVNGQWVRTKKMTIQTSIDGFRIIAERSGDYAGQDEPVLVYNQDGVLEAAKVTVYRFRGEQRYPAAVGVAYAPEYMQTDKDGRPIAMWAKMPRTMLAKCAEALALRKAFPAMLGGLYTSDEMTNAVIEPEPAHQAEPAQVTAAVPTQASTAPPTVEKKRAVKKEPAQAVDQEPPAADPAGPYAPPPKWAARLNKCKTRTDIKAMVAQFEVELEAENLDLKALIKRTYNNLPA